MTNTELILSLIAAAGGVSGIVAFIYVLPTYKKLNAEAKKAGAEASEAIAQSATILLAPLQTRITGLQGQVEALERTLALERQASQEERRVAEQTIAGLREEIRAKDRRLIDFEHHLTNCNGVAKEGS